ncbi:MAG TPA: MEDS domain-containing protein [Verrucomicrobiae bacterium]|nr:MEDS domain-containing protein [Verrucomicrobiae bacterium]
MEAECRHQCLIYEGAPSNQLSALAIMIQRKLNEGHRCLYLNSRPMVAGMRSYLSAIGVDVVYEIAKARLILSSEPATSPDGSFDADLMLNKLEDALDQALADGYTGLWATGDMTWEFGAEKNLEKLVEYERGLEILMQKWKSLSGVCQYHRDTLPREATKAALVTHQNIFVNETLACINPHYSPPEQPSRQVTDPELDKMLVSLWQLQKLSSKAGEPV